MNKYFQCRQPLLNNVKQKTYYEVNPLYEIQATSKLCQ